MMSFCIWHQSLYHHYITSNTWFSLCRTISVLQWHPSSFSLDFPAMRPPSLTSSHGCTTSTQLADTSKFHWKTNSTPWRGRPGGQRATGSLGIPSGGWGHQPKPWASLSSRVTSAPSHSRRRSPLALIGSLILCPHCIPPTSSSHTLITHSLSSPPSPLHPSHISPLTTHTGDTVPLPLCRGNRYDTWNSPNGFRGWGWVHLW